jgi:hypothetical protein
LKDGGEGQGEQGGATIRNWSLNSLKQPTNR